MNHFADERIIQGKVSGEERRDLEETLLRLYFQRAQKQDKPIIIYSTAHQPDREWYERLKLSGLLFNDPDQFYLLTDGRGNVQDMTPLAYQLLDTPEGRFYAKLMVRDEVPPPSERETQETTPLLAVPQV